MNRKFALVSLTAASVLLGLNQPSAAQQRNSDGHLYMGGLTKKQCRLYCQDMHRQDCNMSYYYQNHNTLGPGVCEFTADRNPNVRKRGKYAIYSRWLGKWLFRTDIATHWPSLNVPPPPGKKIPPPPFKKLGGKPSECAKSGTLGQARWTFQSSRTTAWEINGYMCSGASSGYYVLNGSTHEYYRCTTSSGGCTREPASDRLNVIGRPGSPGSVHYTYTLADGKSRTATRYEAYLIRK